MAIVGELKSEWILVLRPAESKLSQGERNSLIFQCGEDMLQAAGDKNAQRSFTQAEHMDHKLKILEASLPLAMLQALTPEAMAAVPIHLLKGDMVAIYKFPFKIGRESRVVKVEGRLERVERSKNDESLPTNDLYLLDRGHRLNISREHCQILKSDGAYALVDRGSACGTKIEGRNVGGNDSGGAAVLHDGEIIAIGTVGSPFVFRFIAFDHYHVVKKED